MLYLILYGIELLTGLKETLLHLMNAITVIFAIGSIILGCYTICAYDDDRDRFFANNKSILIKIYKRGIIAYIALAFTYPLLPSEKTLYLMSGVYLGSEVIEKVKDNALLEKATKAVELKLNEILEEKK